MTVIAFSGFKDVGKSTIAEHVQREWPEPKMVALRSFADGVRDVAESITGIRDYKWKREGVKSKSIEPFGMDGREFLQRVGMMAREKIGEDVWIHALETDIDESVTIIDDLRFPNEAAWASNNGIVIGLTRNGVSLDDDHPSETRMAEHWAEMMDITMPLETGCIDEDVKDIFELLRHEEIL